MMPKFEEKYFTNSEVAAALIHAEEDGQLYGTVKDIDGRVTKIMIGQFIMEDGQEDRCIEVTMHYPSGKKIKSRFRNSDTSVSV